MSKKYYIKGGKAVEVSDEIHEYLTASDRQMRYCDRTGNNRIGILIWKRKRLQRSQAERIRLNV